MPVDVLIIAKTLIKSWTLFRGTDSRIPIERLIGAFIVAVNICYMTLLRTALEAAQCSPAQSSYQDEDTFEVDWMCIKNGSTFDKFAAWFGLFAGIMYGILYPIAFWLLIKRNKESAQNERSYSNDDATAVSADPEAQQSPRARMPAVDTDPKPIKQVIRPFVATYTDQKSSWCLYLLAHKLISVVSVTLSGDIVVLSQALLVVYQTSIGIFTWMESPYWLDFRWRFGKCEWVIASRLSQTIPETRLYTSLHFGRGTRRWHRLDLSCRCPSWCSPRIYRPCSNCCWVPVHWLHGCLHFCWSGIEGDGDQADATSAEYSWYWRNWSNWRQREYWRSETWAKEYGGQSWYTTPGQRWCLQSHCTRCVWKDNLCWGHDSWNCIKSDL